MKKLKILLTILITGLLLVAGTTIAAGPPGVIPLAFQAQTKGALAIDKSPVIGGGWQLSVPLPYYISSDDSGLKTLLGAKHAFNGVFSAELDPVNLAVLRALGIKVEPVQIYQISGKPVCGDGETHPSEQCGEPDLSECPTGYVCESCKCVEQTLPPERVCYPDGPIPWGIEKVQGGSGGAGVKVAVLDTGVYKDHLDLKDNIIDCRDTTKRGVKGGCSDSNGHGTHVAGTIAANRGSDNKGILGVAPQAGIMAIKVCGNSGFCWGDDIAAGIRYAADKEANIISMSLGGDLPDSQIKAAIDYAVSQGVLVVAAAGNDGHLDGYGSIDYPAAYEDVVAVGAIDINDGVAYFSSQGINDDTDPYINNYRDVEFGAPGVSVESTYNDGCYDYKSGTSMATPHVSGLAAKVWFEVGASSDKVREYLQDRAKLYDLDGVGDDIYTGFGLPTAPTSI